MRKKTGDHQVLGNVIEAHQSLRFLGHLSWFDRRVLAAKMKIRLSIFAHKLQFAAYGLHSFRRIQGTCNYLLVPIQNITTTIRLRRPWTRAFFRPASRTVGFSLRFKNSGHVMMFLRRCGLQNTDHVTPFWLFA